MRIIKNDKKCVIYTYIHTYTYIQRDMCIYIYHICMFLPYLLPLCNSGHARCPSPRPGALRIGSGPGIVTCRGVSTKPLSPGGATTEDEGIWHFDANFMVIC